jgi:hypothetical protein
MFRFLLFVVVVGAVALYFTNPTTAEVQAQLGGQLPPQLTGAPAYPSTPYPSSAYPGPADQPGTAPTDQSGSSPGAAPGMQQPPTPPAVAPGAPPAMPDVPAATIPQGEMQLDRKDYYLFSVYKVTVGGQQLPGCIVGIAKQAVPMTPDKCPS